MENAETILVVFLSSALAIFLILAIVLAVKFIQVVNTLKRIADKAESIAEKAESISDIFQKTAGPVAVGRFFTHIANTVFNRSERKNKKG